MDDRKNSSNTSANNSTSDEVPLPLIIGFFLFLTFLWPILWAIAHPEDFNQLASPYFFKAVFIPFILTSALFGLRPWLHKWAIPREVYGCLNVLDFFITVILVFSLVYIIPTSQALHKNFEDHQLDGSVGAAVLALLCSVVIFVCFVGFATYVTFPLPNVQCPHCGKDVSPYHPWICDRHADGPVENFGGRMWSFLGNCRSCGRKPETIPCPNCEGAIPLNESTVPVPASQVTVDVGPQARLNISPKPRTSTSPTSQALAKPSPENYKDSLDKQIKTLKEELEIQEKEQIIAELRKAINDSWKPQSQRDFEEVMRRFAKDMRSVTYISEVKDQLNKIMDQEGIPAEIQRKVHAVWAEREREHLRFRPQGKNIKG